VKGVARTPFGGFSVKPLKRLMPIYWKRWAIAMSACRHEKSQQTTEGRQATAGRRRQPEEKGGLGGRRKPLRPVDNLKR